MRKRNIHAGFLKQNRLVKLCLPSNTTFNLYIYPIGQQALKSEFTAEDLKGIRLLEADDTIGASLFDNAAKDGPYNVCALFAEGVLPGQLTGADLLWDEIYKPANEADNKQSLGHFDNFKVGSMLSSNKSCNFNLIFDNEDDVEFEYCMLAQEDPLGGNDTQIIKTFKGYVEIAKPLGCLRRFSDDNMSLSKIYIPEEYIHRYHLRNGDEVVCTYIESCGQYLIQSVLEVNDTPYYNWSLERRAYHKLNNVFEQELINGAGEYLDVISTEFELSYGDNVFMYINKNTRKAQMLNKFIDELSNTFDKVIYINPQCKHYKIQANKRNVVKFCAMANDEYKYQLLATLSGIAHAKRLVEHGRNVAVLVDDINSIALLDKSYVEDMPTSKTVLNCTKHLEQGSCTMFTIVPLLSDAVTSFTIHDIFRSLESIGVVIDNNEIDLFNSYRR